MMHLGKQVVELRHAPRWQLALANRPAGEVVRALAWLGPEKAETALTTLKRKMPPGVFCELVAAAAPLPTWLAQSVGQAAYGCRLSPAFRRGPARRAGCRVIASASDRARVGRLVSISVVHVPTKKKT